MRALLLVCCLCLPLTRGAVVASVPSQEATAALRIDAESQSQEAMAALTAIIDAESQYNLHLMVLETIEATTSRVVDSEEEIWSTPVMSRLTNTSIVNADTAAGDTDNPVPKPEPTEQIALARRLLGSRARESSPSPGVLVLSRMRPLGLFSSNATHTALHHVARPAVRRGAKQQANASTPMLAAVRRTASRQANATAPMLPAVRRMASRQANATAPQAALSTHKRFY